MGAKIFQSTNKENGIKIDPRTKLFLLFLINFTVFSGKGIVAMIIMATIPIILIVSSKGIKVALTFFVLYLFAQITQEYLVLYTGGIINMIIVMISGMLCRLMPGLMMGYYLVSTTTVSEFISVMERMHIPKNLTIPIAVMFRFFPTIAKESSYISDAMRMRRISMISKKAIKNPICILEYRIVPLLISIVKIGEELSCASLSRGLGGDKKRTNICKVGFKVVDIVFILIGIVALIIWFCF